MHGIVFLVSIDERGLPGKVLAEQSLCTTLLTLNRILCIYWSTGKDLETVAAVQVKDSVCSATDVQGDHSRRLKSWDLQGVR